MTSFDKKIVLVSRDKALAEAMQAAILSRHVQLVVLPLVITQAASHRALEDASLVIADLDATNRDELVGLQQLMTRFSGQLPVVVLTEAFDDAVGRWFLQIRVSDFLRKPVAASELYQTCMQVFNSGAGGEQPTEIITFTAAQGGVGNTTMAVETAMQLMRVSGEHSRGVCLVDLEFQNDACASYLDLEPRLDLAEISAQAERLDIQKLDIMTVKHSSGLALLAAPAHPGEEIALTGEAVLRMLDIAASRYQYVVIDLPRVWHRWTDDILRGSDRVYVVTDMTVPGLRCARRMVKRIQERLSNEVKPRVIVNRMEKQTLFGGGLRRADVERALEGAFAGGISNNYLVVREAIDRGVPLEAVKQGNAVTEDLKRIIFA